MDLFRNITCRFTGESILKYGRRWYSVILVEGDRAGEEIWIGLKPKEK